MSGKTSDKNEKCHIKRVIKFANWRAFRRTSPIRADREGNPGWARVLETIVDSHPFLEGGFVCSGRNQPFAIDARGKSGMFARHYREAAEHGEKEKERGRERERDWRKRAKERRKGKQAAVLGDRSNQEGARERERERRRERREW